MELTFKCYSCKAENDKTLEPTPIMGLERFWRWFNGQPLERPIAYGQAHIFGCARCGRLNRVIPRKE